MGAGLAGLTLADSLSERGLSVTVFEKNTIGSGASGTPGGLVNYATGRRATKTWKAEACYAAIRETLEKVLPFTTTPHFRQNGVLRPALTAKMARKIKEQYEKTSWTDDWCRWMNEDEIQGFHPNIECVDGGLWLPKALTVNVGSFLLAYSEYLGRKGVVIFDETELEIEIGNQNYILRDGEKAWQTENVVFATGYATTSFPYWKDLPLHPIKGQLAIFGARRRLMEFSHSISSLGYIARVQNNKEFVQGSTYEHDFEHLEPDEEGAEYLRKRLKRTLPGLSEEVELIDQWAGVRVSTPNRKPVLGRHKEHRGFHLFTGLGSKGLLYSKFLADHYVEHLLDGKPLFKAVSIERF